MGGIATERGLTAGTRRPRRLRRTAALRALVRETRLSAASLVAPLFVVSGRGRQEAIPSLPGHFRLSPDLVAERALEISRIGAGGVLLFGIPDSKDSTGSGAADTAGPVPQAITRFREYARRAVKDISIPLAPSPVATTPLAPGGLMGGVALRQPVGVVACIGSYNFPLVNIAGKVAPALAPA